MALVADSSAVDAAQENGHVAPESDPNPSSKSEGLAPSDRADRVVADQESAADGEVQPPPQHLPQPEPPWVKLSRESPGGGVAGEPIVVDDGDEVLPPDSQLPPPEAPPGLSSVGPADVAVENTAPVFDVAAIGRFLRRLSAGGVASLHPAPGVQEFHLPDLKVIIKPMDSQSESDDLFGDTIGGRLCFYSRSGCRDCGAVRAFFRSWTLPYVEINLDVFPEREPELMALSGGRQVPQIFVNGRLLGGLVVLNSLRNSGEFENRMKELLARPPSPEAAALQPAVGGVDNASGRAREDRMAGLLRALRHRMPVQDRLVGMKLVRQCFSGGQLVDAVANHLDCSRQKAVEVSQDLYRKHFVHHVFREHDFEDGPHHFYRFMEHDPLFSKYYNCLGSINDYEPKLATELGQMLKKLMVAILEAYSSDDRRHVDYSSISASEEFRRYKSLIHDLQRIDLTALSLKERMSFFLNLYNAMAIHAVIAVGKPESDKKAFFADFEYMVGGYPYSLSTMKNGILRSNRREQYSILKPFSASDRRLQLAVEKMNPLIHFGLCNATRSSPVVRFFSPDEVDVELRHAVREFFLDGAAEVDLESRTVKLTRIIKWYSGDFGQDRDILTWCLNYLDSTKAGLLTHLLNDGGPVNIAYQSYDWSLNS